jgi:hypothetical protein
MNKIIGALVCCCLLSAAASAQNTLGRAFVLGDNEQSYEQLATKYAVGLLQVNDNNMEAAFDSWLDLLQAVDDYAGRINYDIKGVKVYLHVFVAADGTLDHIGFLPRPDSRNVPVAELQAFFSGFARSYRMPVTGDQPFNHYAGATFPTLNERTGR